MCAYYDAGGEGVSYHDTTPENLGSGNLNPIDGSYLHGFRAGEGVDTSYTKSAGDTDNSPFNFVEPPMEMLYLGWTEPGEWTKYTVRVDRTGTYSVRLLYTSNTPEGAVGVRGVSRTRRNGGDWGTTVGVPSTNREDDPVGWRQWHHWSIVDLPEVHLVEGEHIMTLETLSGGQMNYAWLEFELVEN